GPVESASPLEKLELSLLKITRQCPFKIDAQEVQTRAGGRRRDAFRRIGLQIAPSMNSAHPSRSVSMDIAGYVIHGQLSNLHLFVHLPVTGRFEHFHFEEPPAVKSKFRELNRTIR